MSVCQRVHASELLDLLIDQRPRFLRQHPPQRHVRVFVVSQCNANRRELAGDRMLRSVTARAISPAVRVPEFSKYPSATTCLTRDE